MKTLLIMRHAKSSWSNMGLSDYQRPLNSRGKNDAPRMGELLKAESLTPDLIISSSAKRAATTAELAAIACDYDSEIRYEDAFYHADPETYIEVLQDAPNDASSIMIVGHNPGMEMLVTDLTGEHERFSTANIAHVELPINQWRELNEATEGKLCNLWRPKEL